MHKIHRNRYLLLTLFLTACSSPGAQVDWSQSQQELTISPTAVYQIKSAASGKCIGVASNSTANSAIIEERTCNGSVGQNFNIATVATGYYAIKSTNSLKCMDVTGKSTADGAAIIQYTCNNSSTNQQWAIATTSGSAVRLTAHHSGKVAEVNGGGTADGTAVVQRTWNGASYQQFVLSTGTGGTGGTGGATSSGGSTATGGTVTGGSTATGGSTGAGGTTVAGGSTTGGTTVTGGTTAAGGSTGTGGIDRSKVALAGGWKFIASDSLAGAEATTFNDSAWSSVSVPHTWDTVLGVTTHTNSWYRTHFTVNPADPLDRVYVYFEGVFQIADVYVNGQHLGQHRGGFTRFIFDATAAVKIGGDNVLALKVSNSTCSDCLPDGTPRLYKGYGGIYRAAWLMTTNKYHLATTDYASSGIYVSASNVSSASASVSERILVTNNTAADQTLTVKSMIADALGTAVLTTQSDVLVKAGTTATTTHTGTVSQPTLWKPGNPNLYTVQVTVSAGGVLVDSVTEHIGFRTYKLSTTDFTLNGVSTRLRGVAKHQETEYHASAVSADELTADWDNLVDLGVNYVRLVHYPHAQLEYDLADQRGIMVWSENGHTNSAAETANGDNINREMVYQNWNHPSIIFWSAGNEASGVAATGAYASVLRAADPSRPIVYASDGQNPANIDFIFHNTYAGWYSGTMYDFLTAPDHWVSESGAGMVIAAHAPNAFAVTPVVNSYEPEEYGALVDEIRFDDMFRNPSHVPAFSEWVFRDISDTKYKGLLNSKGLLTFAGYKKDVYYHYKSLLQSKPVVHLVGRNYFVRSPDAAGQAAVKVYSNAASLTLTINGSTVGTLANNQYTHPNGTPVKDVFYWTNALRVGKNVVTVDDGQGNTDSMTVYFLGTGTTLPSDPGAKIANLTSSNGPAYFVDAPVWDQRPFTLNFDGTGDNAFDVVPAAVVGASWIATKRQSDSTKLTNLAFDVASSADLFIVFTSQSSVPAWITAAGFTDTGVTGRWRDNTPKLVNYALYKRSVAAGDHVTLQPTAIDYVVLVK
jgi:beta-galactosidase